MKNIFVRGLIICLIGQFISGCSTNTESDTIEEIDSTAPTEEILFNPEDSNKINDPESLWIREEQQLLWVGVRDCCDKESVTKEPRIAFDSWLQEQKSKHPELEVGRSGYTKTACKPRQSDGGWFGKDHCTGKVQMKYVVEFVHPVKFILKYIAKRRTKWLSHPAERKPEIGYIEKGEIVYFSQDVSEDDTLMEALLKDGSRRLVNAQDFEKQ